MSRFWINGLLVVSLFAIWLFILRDYSDLSAGPDPLPDAGPVVVKSPEKSWVTDSLLALNPFSLPHGPVEKHPATRSRSAVRNPGNPAFHLNGSVKLPGRSGTWFSFSDSCGSDHLVRPGDSVHGWHFSGIRTGKACFRNQGVTIEIRSEPGDL